MREGSVVVVLGKLDDRIHEASAELVVGTLWYEIQDEAIVILPDGLLWKGPKRDLAPEAEQITSDETKESS